eukprot:CAMPEP_0184344480 /NCGR_PEP_ID=MMETSP1089-20130417/12975_1 /TAXON_ID=38269 ORGANISM="Gloeochaete wittrockiana, Strain SAG46.84" /NCGR_SAMPLE_ID=MMETSP1089 /ASSEMBLY_ACC=CAM_ASM_000445 /LENGTH=184 /DNA_ID=CAMNT_0026674325 /DNA_START=119 /DNA_END=673 /DNA_ORIENTATION=-
MTSLDSALKSVLDDERRRAAYSNHLKKIFAHENFDFYFAVEGFKQASAARKKEIAKEIYDKFISDDAEFALGDVDLAVRESISEDLDNPPSKMFDALQRRCFMVMAHSTIQRFLEEESQSSKSSSSSGSPPSSPPSSSSSSSSHVDGGEIHSTSLVARLVELIVEVYQRISGQEAEAKSGDTSA